MVYEHRRSSATPTKTSALRPIICLMPQSRALDLRGQDFSAIFRTFLYCYFFNCLNLDRQSTANFYLTDETVLDLHKLFKEFDDFLF